MPEGVRMQVLTAARPDLVARTLEAVEGAREAIVHLYNSTSTTQRRVVFEQGREGVKALAVRGAQQIRERASDRAFGHAPGPLDQHPADSRVDRRKQQSPPKHRLAEISSMVCSCWAC